MNLFASPTSALPLQRQPPSAALLRVLKLSSWVATLLLVLYHVRYLVLASYASVAPHTLWTSALYFVTGLGHQAFTIFFVTQGFLLARALAARQAAGQLAYAPLLINKAVRTYAMLLPVLLLGAVLDTLGARYLHAGRLYTAYPDFSVLTLDGLTLLGQLAMLQPLLVPTFGSNGVLWVLGFAWWYGVVFVLLFALVQRVRWLGMAVCVALAVAAVLNFPSALVSWALVWLSGAAVVPLSTRPRQVARLPALLVLGAVLVLARYLEARTALIDGEAALRLSFVKNFVFGLGMAWLLLSVAVTPARRQRSWAGRLADRLSDDIDRFSCTLFFGHFPVLMAGAALAHQVAGMPLKGAPGWPALLWMAALVTLVYAVGWGWYQLGERHAGALVRRVLFKSVRRQARARERPKVGL